MSGTVMTKSELARLHSTSTGNLSRTIDVQTLALKDARTTIDANKNSQDAYEATMKDVSALRDALVQSATNINSIDVAWANLDNNLASSR